VNYLAEYCNDIFNKSILRYHTKNAVDAPLDSPYPINSFEFNLYEKNWIDTIQWHLEDLIRAPDIDKEYGCSVKSTIDKFNQMRTDKVELIDEYFIDFFKDVTHLPDARHNSESLSWVLDRLSILDLKIYHIDVEIQRHASRHPHTLICVERKGILMRQHADLLQSFNWLFEDIQTGKKVIKVYKQLKMYNDPLFVPGK
jgi:Protein of unknown function (DUF4254)